MTKIVSRKIYNHKFYDSCEILDELQMNSISLFPTDHMQYGFNVNEKNENCLEYSLVSFWV